MTFEVGITGTFDAQHHLVGDFGPASDDHQHTYRVEVMAAGDRLKADGTLLDITRLQAALEDVLAPLRGRDLNDIDAFATPNPTAEVVARYTAERIATALRGEGTVIRISTRVWESPEAFAAYTVSVT